MSIMNNVITPIFQLFIYLIMLGWFIFIIVIIFKRIFKNFGFYFKYKLLKRAWPEKKVEWCMNAYERGWNEAKIRIFLLLNNKPDKKPYSKKEINEIAYIFSQVVKNNDKGGVKNGRNRSSDEQIKEIKEN